MPVRHSLPMTYRTVETADSSPTNTGSPAFTSDRRFCLDGVATDLAWELPEQGKNLTVWGSVCPDVASSGRIESTTFLAPANFSLFVTGLIGLPGLRLTLKNLETGEQLELRPKSVPNLHWEHAVSSFRHRGLASQFS